jgi:sodium/proline symporter
MELQTIIAFTIYFVVLISIGLIASWKDNKSSGDITSSRNLNYWVTAISAHASDMSTWIFMGLPAAVFSAGLFQTWIPVGLVLCMFLNWHFIAPKLRRETERYKCFSLAGYFAARFDASAGFLHVFTLAASLIFFIAYISAGFIGMGILFNSLFGISYNTGLLICVAAIIIYTLVGGYVAVAWTDFFQGLFLLGALVIVPIVMISKVGNIEGVMQSLSQQNLSLSMIPDFSFETFINIILLTFGWGLGYFGQPHILSKFMGIRDPNEMYKSKYIGTAWLILTLISATCVGLIGAAYFKGSLEDPQLVFILMVKNNFSLLSAGFILSGVLAATISTADSQILVLANNITEDFYQRLIRKNKARIRELRFVSRISILIVILIPLIVAYGHPSDIFNIVLYSWTGLGASFGPVLIMALYYPKANKYGAISGLCVGALTAAIWPFVDDFIIGRSIPGLVPGFIISILTIFIVSKITAYRNA